MTEVEDLGGQRNVSKLAALNAAMDVCNARFGRGAVVPARAGLTEKRTWSTKFEMRSPRYTTQVAELPTAHCYEPNRGVVSVIVLWFRAAVCIMVLAFRRAVGGDGPVHAHEPVLARVER